MADKPSARIDKSYVDRYLSARDEEDFLEFESKVNQVMKMLDDAENMGKTNEEGEDEEEE